MHRRAQLAAVLVFAILAVIFLFFASRPRTSELAPGSPTLDDFWNGRASWTLDVPDTGLPSGESDTISIGSGEYWSYLHASTQSAGITDSCGDPVEFPGCVTRWVSTDGGRHFDLPEPRCLIACTSCPCPRDDHTRQQQYPRVARGPAGNFYIVFEHDAAVWLTRSGDGITWDQPKVIPYTGLWKQSEYPCDAPLRIGKHPFLPQDSHDCMVGGPPGLFITGERLYVIMGFGQNPGHIGCYWSPLALIHFEPCGTSPLISAAPDYGPLDALGAAANPTFGFRYLTSADVIEQGGMFYMTFEGARGPDSAQAGGDNQFALGFARSKSIDSGWELYPHNPILGDVGNNWAVGHADLIVEDGVMVMYTGTPEMKRGQYVLEFSSEP